MFGKEENKAIRKTFWTGFGQYMSRFESARGPRQKWLNYRTGVRHIFFRQEAEQGWVRVAIELQHKDAGIRELFWEQFEELKLLLHNGLDEEWIWEADFTQETGRDAARIYVEKAGWDVYQEADWPAMWTWLGDRLRLLDELWADAYDLFKDLSD